MGLALHCLEATQLQVQDLLSLIENQSQQIERLTAQVKEIAHKANDAFVWKISNFKVFLDEAKRRGRGIMLSKLFSLWKIGYVLKIRLEFRAHPSLSSEDFLELNIVVVPGEFDPLLSWPFREKLRLRLIDQNPASEHERKNLSYLFNFERKENQCSRPLTEKDVLEFKCAYVALRELKERSYIVNDTIFLMVSNE